MGYDLDTGFRAVDLDELATEANAQVDDVATPPTRKPGFYFKDKVGLLAAKLADDIQAIGPLAYGVDNIMWSYRDGVWRPDPRVVAHRATTLLGDRYRRSHSVNAEDIIRAQTPKITCDPVSEVINFRNGLYLWQADLLRDHTPDMLTTVQLSVDWNPDATCPAFDKFLGEVVPEDMVALVWEAIGYLLYSGNPLHRAYMLMAPGVTVRGRCSASSVRLSVPPTTPPYHSTVSSTPGSLPPICSARSPTSPVTSTAPTSSRQRCSKPSPAKTR
jgi:hypothetical protein